VNRFAFAQAKSIPDAAAAASSLVADAMIGAADAAALGNVSIVKAGGIDLLDLMKEGLLAPSRVTNLKDIPALDTIVEDEGGLRLGPMATLASLAEHPSLRQRYAALTEALASIASPQIRNVATIGGNLLQRPRCWYLRSQAYHCLRKGGGHCFAIAGENQYHAIFNNMPCAIVHPSTAATVLVAMGATIELTDAAGTSRTLSLEDFFMPVERDLQRENDLKPHEILSAIRLPALPENRRVVYVRQGEKDSFDWPLADVTVALDLAADGTCQNAAVVLGAAAPVPHRARAAERVLAGVCIDESAAAAAGRVALEGATPLSKNAYKLPLFETLVRRAILKAAA
jgi:xanthine dehydrogenase YagS FAD-binding subunit